MTYEFKFFCVCCLYIRSSQCYSGVLDTSAVGWSFNLFEHIWRINLSRLLFENSFSDFYFHLIWILFILDKKCYRESYISDDLDLDPPGSESSPGLSRHSTSSSGIEADARQHSISTEMTSMEEGQPHRLKGLGSATRRDSPCTSLINLGNKPQIEDEEWREEGEDYRCETFQWNTVVV